ncbi:hypothetical protein VaNZ11_001160 [Volvox africanus]|uniref:UVR domain-containing protein n=1 Tax=Volvox africanus TaxID=51714 RepID=A0ABQ5RPF1_9CHLO|nr:hypothetical protein VaNZ11_001160 [Volvox africanus]
MLARRSCSSISYSKRTSTAFGCSIWHQRTYHIHDNAHYLRKSSRYDEVPASRGLEVVDVDVDETWQRFNLIQRKLKIAVSDEDYVMAAKLRDEQKTLLEGLSPVQQYALGQVARLRSGTVQEQLQTIRNLAEAGEVTVIPDLATCLAVPELAGAAEKAMWAIFMRARRTTSGPQCITSRAAMRTASRTANWSFRCSHFTSVRHQAWVCACSSCPVSPRHWRLSKRLLPSTREWPISSGSLRTCGATFRPMGMGRGCRRWWWWQWWRQGFGGWEADEGPRNGINPKRRRRRGMGKPMHTSRHPNSRTLSMFHLTEAVERWYWKAAGFEIGG